MSELAFWRSVVQDRSDFLGAILNLLEENGIRYCAVGGVAVNAYAEPVVAIDDLDRATALVERDYNVDRFEHGINVRDAGSGLQVQFELDPRRLDYVDRAEMREVLGVMIPVAVPRDLIRAKVAEASDSARLPSKRQKDLADISRLLEVMPELTDQVPAGILER